MSENHVRCISATLSLLDEALCRFDRWALGHEVTSVLYEMRNTLSVTQRRTISHEVAEMKAMLRELQATLNLRPSVHTVHKMISGSCALLWASLLELDGRHLSRYGEVPPGLAEYLDPRLAVLNERLRNISYCVSKEVSNRNDGSEDIATE